MHRVEANQRPAEVHVVASGDRHDLDHRVAEQLAGLGQPATRRPHERLAAIRVALLDPRDDRGLQQQLGHDARGDAPEQVGRDRDQHRRGEDEQLLAADVRDVLPDLRGAQLVAGVEHDRAQGAHGHQVDHGSGPAAGRRSGSRRCRSWPTGSAPPPRMQAVLLTPPGMIVSPPAMLEHMFETPIALSVRVRVRLAAERVDLVDGRDRRQRLDAVDQGQGQDRREQRPPQRVVGEQPPEVGHDDAVLERLRRGSGSGDRRSGPGATRASARTPPRSPAAARPSSQRALNDASTKISARQKIPTRKTFGSIAMNCDGASRTIPQNSCASKWLPGLPKISGSCLAMIKSPIDAEHPLDHRGREDRGEAGQLEPGQDDLHQARQADGAQQERIADSRSPRPSSSIAAKSAGASPAAGPLIVTYDPPRNGSTSPAMIAEISPQIGGAPDATAMPSENGSETSETTSPAEQVVSPVLQPGQAVRGLLRGQGGTDLHGSPSFRRR